MKEKKEKDLLLEVCVDSVESALAAQKGGADRIELCADLVIGGSTPTEAFFRAVRRAVDLPIHVMVRPRYGDFLYTDHEYEVMLDNIRSFRELGADGIVTGFLMPDGSLDTIRMRQVRESGEGINLTLHRAFDMTRDPMKAAGDAVECGVDIILTSGQKENAADGILLLKNLQEGFGNQIQFMAGSGVGKDNIPLIYEQTGIRNFHMSGKTEMQSGMKFRNPNVSMGIQGISEYSIIRTNAEYIKGAAEICRLLK